MLLDFHDGLTRVGKFDVESVLLSDRHYSRQKPGTNQFMPPGKTIVLRDNAGAVVFGWLWQEKRDDDQEGYNCSIFRNESPRKASEIIREAEKIAFACWGQNRVFTYVDPAQTKPIFAFRDYPRLGIKQGDRIVGLCFRRAGYKLRIKKNGKPHVSTKGLWLFVKRNG